MNKNKFIEVNIEHIDFDDQSYIFTFEPGMSQLIASIKNAGIISPPILEFKTDRTYRIVTGSKRISALVQLKIKNFTAKVFYSKNNNKPTLDIFKLNLYENIGTRELNIVEKTNIIFKLINLFNLSREQVIKKYLPLLELETNPKIIDRYLPLIDLEISIKKAVAEEFISIEIAHSFMNLSQEERLKIFNLFNQLKLGKNRQKEFMRLLQDIKAISRQTIDQILENENIKNIIQDQQLTSSVKINRIKDVLKKLRYPNYTKIEKEFNQLKKELKLPPNIMLRAPAFFEGEKYSLEMSFKNQKEFAKLVDLLKSIADSEKLLKLEELV